MADLVYRLLEPGVLVPAVGLAVALTVLLGYVQSRSQLSVELFDRALQADEDGFYRLLERGARPNATSRSLSLAGTALHAVAAGGSGRMAQHLLSRGADVNARGARAVREGTMLQDGLECTAVTPLHVASLHGNTEVARILLAQGADVRARTAEGDTALHLAVKGGHRGVTEVLVFAGAEANEEDGQGHTPLGLAMRQMDEDLVRAVSRGMGQDFG